METQAVIDSLKEDGFGWWLTGFFDAEGSLLISRRAKRRRDGGRYFYPYIKLSARYDYRELLERIARRLRCGHVRGYFRRGPSRPMAEYRALAYNAVARWGTVLHHFGLRGVKRQELAEWQEARRLWSEIREAPGASRNGELWYRIGECKRRMERSRAQEIPSQRLGLGECSSTVVPPLTTRTSHDSVGLARAHYLAGLVTGDGWFGIVRNRTSLRPAFSVTLRADNLSLLREQQRVTGVGSISVWQYSARSPRKPAAIWQVAKREEQAKLSHVFDIAPPRGRKMAECQIWQEAVREHARRVNGDWRGTTSLGQRSRMAKARLRCLRQAMTELRAYRPGRSLAEWARFVDGTLAGVRSDAQLPLLIVA